MTTLIHVLSRIIFPWRIYHFREKVLKGGVVFAEIPHNDNIVKEGVFKYGSSGLCL